MPATCSTRSPLWLRGSKLTLLAAPPNMQVCEDLRLLEIDDFAHRDPTGNKQFFKCIQTHFHSDIELT